MYLNSWKGLVGKPLWVALGLWGGALTGALGLDTEAWANTCRAPTLPTDGSSTAPAEQKFCTGPWVYRTLKGYPCDPAVSGAACVGGILYEPKSCQNKAFGSMSRTTEAYSTDVGTTEWREYGCWPGYGCGWDGDTWFLTDYRDCDSYAYDTVAQNLSWLQANYQDPNHPITYTSYSELISDSGWVYQSQTYMERTYWDQCFVEFANVVTEWNWGQNANICGVTQNLVFDDGVRYSSPMLTRAQLKSLVPAAEIRDASATPAPPRCTTADEMPDSTQAEAQAKYTRLKNELDTGTASAVAAGQDEATFRHLLVGALKRLYELRGHLLTTGQRTTIEGYYVTWPEREKATVRVDSTVDFDWASSAPSTALRPDTFSARWTGKVTPRYSETYTFITTTDDGMRLWVNNQIIIDTWIDQSPTEHRGQLVLEANRAYDIKLEFYEQGGVAVSRLAWESPRQPREVIPASQLQPAQGGGQGLLGEYYDNRNFSSGVVCGNRWTPPMKPATCPDLSRLDAQLGMCQRIALPHTSLTLASQKQVFCEELGIGVSDVSPDCGMNAYWDEYLAMTSELQSKLDASALRTATTAEEEQQVKRASAEAWRGRMKKYLFRAGESADRLETHSRTLLGARPAKQ